MPKFDKGTECIKILLSRKRKHARITIEQKTAKMPYLGQSWRWRLTMGPVPSVRFLSM